MALFQEYLHSFAAVEKKFPTSTFHFSLSSNLLNSSVNPRHVVGYEQWQTPSVPSGIGSNEVESESADSVIESVRDAATQPDLFLVSTCIPSPDDFQMNEGDTYYLSWFVFQGPTFMGIEVVLPTICGHVYALSSQHPILHEAVRLFSAHFSKLTTGKINSDVHRRLSLFRPKLQQALISGKFDEGHIVAVFLVAALYHYGGNLSSSATHLSGLSVMLAHDQRRHRGSSPTPLVSFIKRQCIRLFNRIGSAHQKVLAIAPTVGTKHWDTRWINDFTPLSLVPAMDAGFAFQDFQFAVLYFYHRTVGMRKSTYYDFTHDKSIDTSISREGKNLISRIKEFQAWLKVRARGPTLWTRDHHPDPNLDYFPGNDPPIMGLTEPCFAYHLLASYHLLISITVITELNIGPCCRERVEAASELCRHYAVLQVAPPESFDIPILTSLFSAGLTFSPLSHPDGLHLTAEILTSRICVDT